MPKTGLSAAEIRDKAIEVTVEQMRRHGFDRVRLVDIAKDLGVSHAALYSHFADRRALLDARQGNRALRGIQHRDLLGGRILCECRCKGFVW